MSVYFHVNLHVGHLISHLVNLYVQTFPNKTVLLRLPLIVLFFSLLHVSSDRSSYSGSASVEIRRHFLSLGRRCPYPAAEREIHHSIIIYWEGLDLTLSILPCLQGRIIPTLPDD